MVTLRIASDFHLEFYDYKTHIGSPNREINDFVCLPRMENEDQQTLLLAGDIIRAVDINLINQTSRMDFLFDSLASRFYEVYIIPGNHEYYQGNIYTADKILKQYYSKWPNIHFLQNDTVELKDGVMLFGATLWTDFDKSNPNSISFAKVGMNDFAGIIVNGAPDQQFKPRFSPEQSVSLHEDSLFLLREFMNKYRDSKKVVMTHHAPSLQSIAPKYKGSLLNSAFSSDLDYAIIEYEPNLWIHGHHHSNSDYMIEKTRVICNPYGYYTENTKEYNTKLIMEI